jgi:hypothetical protein
VFIAIVADGARRNRPVLLFDVGVVILMAGPTPSERDLLLRAVAIELMVDELRTIVGIDVQ